MLESLFSFILLPLQYSYFVIYEAILYLVTSNFGWALIALSIFTSLVITPLEKSVSHITQKEKLLQSILSPQIKTIKAQSKGAEQNKRIHHLYQRYSYHPFFAIRSSLGLLLQLPFLIGAYYMIESYKDFNKEAFFFIHDLALPDQLLSGINLLPILMTLFNLSALALMKQLSSKEKIQALVIAFIFLVLLYSSPSALLIYWTSNNFILLIKTIIQRLSIDYSAIKLPSLITEFYSLLFGKSAVQQLYFPAIILSCFLVFFYFSFNVYFSDLGSFPFQPHQVLSTEIIYCLTALIIAFVLWIAFTPLRTLFSISASLFIIIGLCHAFYVDIDFGVFDHFIFTAKERMYIDNSDIDFPINIFAIIFLIAFMAFKKIHYLKKIFIALSVATLLVSIYQYMTYFKNAPANLVEKISSQDDQEWANVSSELPEEKKVFFSFAKDKPNVIIVMLDAFTGGHLPEILARKKDIKDALDGFIYYPDTISSGEFTVLGKAGILGGIEATPLVLNLDKERVLEDKIHDAWGSAFSNDIYQDFDIRIQEAIWLKKDKLKERLKHNNRLNTVEAHYFWENAAKFWEQTAGLDFSPYYIKTQAVSDRFFAAFGLFKLVPLKYKRLVYRHGTWLTAIAKSDNMARTNLKEISFLNALPYLSNTNSTQPTYTLLSSLTTHMPWVLSANCLPVIDGQTTGEGYEAHVQNEICALESLSKWLEWMKKEGIYDNSLIIFVSDHGRGDSKQLINIYRKKHPDRKKYPADIHALLLVKPFNAHGELKTDDTALMANYDVPALIEQALAPERKIEQAWLDKNRERCGIAGEAGRHMQDSDYLLKINAKVCITGSLFDIDNWKIEEKAP